MDSLLLSLSKKMFAITGVLMRHDRQKNDAPGSTQSKNEEKNVTCFV